MHCSGFTVSFLCRAPDEHENRTMIMHELIPDLTIYKILHWSHATFKAFSFENAKQHEAYRIVAF